LDKVLGIPSQHQVLTLISTKIELCAWYLPITFNFSLSGIAHQSSTKKLGVFLMTGGFQVVNNGWSRLNNIRSSSLPSEGVDI